MTFIEHGELVRRALEYVQEERCRRPDAPLDAAQLARLFSETGQEPSAPCKR